MARRVILGSTHEEEMLDVKLLLEAGDCDVQLLAGYDDILRETWTEGVDLIVVAETLVGGTGTALCARLKDQAGRPILLYLGKERVPGSDANVPDRKTAKIANTARELLQRLPAEVPIGSATSAAATVPSSGTATASAGAPARTAPVTAASTPAPAPAKSSAPSRAGAASPTRAAAQDPSGSEILRAIATENLDGLVRRVRESDYFEILGVAPDSPEDEIRAAYSERTGSLKDFAREPAAIRAHLEEVRSALDEAFEVLIDPGLRLAYTRNRPGGSHVLG